MKILPSLIGLILIIIGIFGIVYFWNAVLELIKGGLGLFLTMVGLLLLIIGLTD